MQSDILLKKKYEEILPILNEKQTRLILAAEAKSMGRGGLSKVSTLSGISRVTLNIGIKELASVTTEDVVKNERMRKQGGGRKKETDKNSEIEKVVEEIVNPHTMGDPMKALLWTSKSLRNIAGAAKKKGCNISHKLVGVILKNAGYSLQGNRKTDEGSSHEDRDAQFVHINNLANEFLSLNEPVISVDCKKKELVGNFKNAGHRMASGKKAYNSQGI
jgi:transposase